MTARTPTDQDRVCWVRSGSAPYSRLPSRWLGSRSNSTSSLRQLPPRHRGWGTSGPYLAAATGMAQGVSPYRPQQLQSAYDPVCSLCLLYPPFFAQLVRRP